MNNIKKDILIKHQLMNKDELKTIIQRFDLRTIPYQIKLIL